MNHLANITLKEFKDLMTPSSVIMIVFIMVLFVVIGCAYGSTSESATEPADIGIVYDGDPDIVIGGNEYPLIQVINAAYDSVYGKGTSEGRIINLSDQCDTDRDGGLDTEEILDSLDRLGLKYVVGIPSELPSNIVNHERTLLSTYYIFESSGLASTITNAVAATMVNQISNVLSTLLVADLTGDLETVDFVENPIYLNPDSTYTRINGTTQQGADPTSISSALMGQNLMLPIVVMVIIMMVGSVVISSMGNEKENKTLETLLTMPVKRTTVVAGKLIAATLFGLFNGAIYMVGMMFYTNGITVGLGESVDLEALGLTLDTLDWFLVFLVLFLSIFSALGACMILGAFTKNYKMAQTMTMPISVLSMIPMMVLIFSSWDGLSAISQFMVFAIPFSHPMMVMDNLMFGNLELVVGGIAYLLILDTVLLLLTVKVYNSDILITGLGQTKTIRKLMSRFEKKKGEDNENRRGNRDIEK